MSTEETILLAQQTVALLIDATAIYATFSLTRAEAVRRTVVTSKERLIMVWAMVAIPVGFLASDLIAKVIVSSADLGLELGTQGASALAICIFTASFFGGIVAWRRSPKVEAYTAPKKPDDQYDWTDLRDMYLSSWRMMSISKMASIGWRSVGFYASICGLRELQLHYTSRFEWISTRPVGWVMLWAMLVVSPFVCAFVWSLFFRLDETKK